MKEKVNEKFVILYDTAKKCLLIVDHLFSALEQSTLQAEDSVKVTENNSVVPEIYISALGLIDFFHRFNEIISTMPLISKKQPELKSLSKALKPVKDCRNYLQHMRGDLMKNESISYPILGAISWTHEGRNYVLSSSQPTKNFSMPCIVFDTFENKYICKYQLVIGGHEIQLDTVYNEIKLFWAWLENSVVMTPSHLKDYTWGKPRILYSEFKRP